MISSKHVVSLNYESSMLLHSLKILSVRLWGVSVNVNANSVIYCDYFDYDRHTHITIVGAGPGEVKHIDLTEDEVWMLENSNDTYVVVDYLQDKERIELENACKIEAPVRQRRRM